MKRKRKHNKGKHKGGPAVAPSAKSAIPSGANAENESSLEEFDKDNVNDSRMEIDTPTSTRTDHPRHVANSAISDDSTAKGLGKPLGRVTVKLKTQKVMESQLTYSDAPTLSDTDKSSQQMGLEKQGVGSVAAEKTEDSANSLPEIHVCVSPSTVTAKTGSIKIKASKDVPLRDGNPVQEGQKTPIQGRRRYDKEELDTALMVIKKVMKMDASEPFNVPVNPVALGIPDYFDVIDTPMDFGTICNNLENGAKYANSEDVYKDVQYIWDNCFKYNNKGDYILDLLKRVKKNFTKLWTTAGLYSEQPIGTNGVESSQEKIAPTTQIKVYVKGGLKKSSKKGHGRRHKSDCLCAICVLKRRRREREENARIAQGLTGEASPQSPSGENSTSDMDDSPLDRNMDVEEEQRKDAMKKETDEDNGDHHEDNRGIEEEGNGVEMKDRENNEATEQLHKSREDENIRSLQELANKSGYGIQSDTRGENPEMHRPEGTEAGPQQKHKELKEKPTKVKASQIKLSENPLLLDLCGTLFPDDAKNSVWVGPRSLVRHCPIDSRATSSKGIQAAINLLMNRPN